MRHLRQLLCALMSCCGLAAPAQTILLDTFNAGSATGAVRAGTSWVGQTTATATTLIVGGTAQNDSGWGSTGLTLNANGMNFITVTAQRDAGNTASTFAIQFEDRNLSTQIFSVSTSAFALGSLTTVQIPITAWAADFSPSQITGWNIGGGGLGNVPFRMTFDNLSLNSAANVGTVAPGATGDFGAKARAAGENITFSVTATGTAPFSYQWFKNATVSLANPTATTSALTLSALTPADAGTYTCTVTNAAGSIVSGSFVLSVAAQTATVTLGSLAATYDGTAKSVVATTSPAGLPVSLTYAGRPSAPTNAGSYEVVATVNSPVYAGSATGTLVIARVPQIVTFAPLPAVLRVGTAFTLAASASSGGPVTFSLITGAATLDGASLTPNSAVPITVRATQAGTTNELPAATDLVFTTAKQSQGIDFAAPADFSGAPAPIALSATASSGLSVSFTVVAGAATIAGATITPTASGPITVRASQLGNDAFNAAPDVTRTFVAALPAPPPPLLPTRLASFSTRARVGAGDQVAIAGFSISGGGSKSLLVRAVGPTLTSFDVPGSLPAPAIEVFRDNVALARNTGWSAAGAGPTIAAAAASVGAFPLATGTADAALVTALPPGNYSAVISGADARTGVGLVEVYDLGDSAPGARIANLSVRATSGAGADTLIVGLSVQGTAPQRFLIRAIGPALTQFGVVGALARPQLAVYSGGIELARNAGWSTSPDAAQLVAAAGQVGAFALPAGSADSALAISLLPGGYTAHVSTTNSAAGVALVEVYEIP